MADFWDGTSRMPFVLNDGGRMLAGYKGSTGDCGARALSIVTGMGYQAAYDLINDYAKRERRIKKKPSNARTGVWQETMRDIMRDQGYIWLPCMRIGSGCTVRLIKGQLPSGRLMVLVSRHYTSVIDGVIHDTHDPQRETIHTDANGVERMSHRCVYGYWFRPGR